MEPPSEERRRRQVLEKGRGRAHEGQSEGEGQELDDYKSKQSAVFFLAYVKQSKCLSLQSKKDLLALANGEGHKDEDDAAHAADKDASEAEQVKSEGDEEEEHEETEDERRKRIAKELKAERDFKEAENRRATRSRNKV